MVNRRNPTERLSDETFNRIVEAAAELAEARIFDNAYKEIGRTLVKRSLQAIGTVASTIIILNGKAIADWLRILF